MVEENTIVTSDAPAKDHPIHWEDAVRAYKGAKEKAREGDVQAQDAMGELVAAVKALNTVRFEGKAGSLGHEASPGEKGQPFSGFTGDLSHWTFSRRAVVDFRFAFADAVGFTSDLLPWLSQLSGVTVVHLKDMLLGAWDVSAGALLFRRKLMLRNRGRHQAVTFLRHSVRHTKGVLGRSVRRTRLDIGQPSTNQRAMRLQDACRLAWGFLSGSGSLDAKGYYDPYDILLYEHGPKDEKERAGALEKETGVNRAIEYAWVVFATLRDALTRGAAVMRSATAVGEAARGVDLLAHLRKAIIDTARKHANASPRVVGVEAAATAAGGDGDSVDWRLAAMSPEFLTFCKQTRELRFPDLWCVFQQPAADNSVWKELGWRRVDLAFGQTRQVELIPLEPERADADLFQRLVRYYAGPSDVGEIPTVVDIKTAGIPSPRNESEAKNKTLTTPPDDSTLMEYVYLLDAINCEQLQAQSTQWILPQQAYMDALFRQAIQKNLAHALQRELLIRRYALNSLRAYSAGHLYTNMFTQFQEQLPAEAETPKNEPDP